MKTPKFPKDKIDYTYNPKGGCTFLGWFWVLMSFILGIISENLTSTKQLAVFSAFVSFLIGIYILIKCHK